MRAVKGVIALLAAGALAVGAGVAFASTEAGKAPSGSKPATAAAKMPEASKTGTASTAAKPGVRRVRGEVTSVEPTARTMVVKVMEGGKEMTVGVDVTDKTVIRRGKAQATLSDIKVGDRVWMKYEHASDKLVADVIRVLRPTHVAAKH